jgi:circadian clock protein KaiC
MSSSGVINQIQTGIVGLDEILLGGVRKGNIVLVEGAPGTGKTTLGLEFIYRGASEFGEPGLIFTFELSPEKLLADAAGFGWDFEPLIASGKVKIVYTNPAVIIQELQSTDGVLADEIRAASAKRLLIDGLTPLKLFGDTPNGHPFRESLHLLVEALQRFGVTGLLTREAGETPGHGTDDLEHERFVGDTIVTLSRRTRKRSVHRFVEITKSRGQDFIAGEHTMRIEPGKGIRVYRRAQSRPKAYFPQPTSIERSSIGHEELDRMLGGGLLDGSITLTVASPAPARPCWECTFSWQVWNSRKRRCSSAWTSTLCRFCEMPRASAFPSRNT